MKKILKVLSLSLLLLSVSSCTPTKDSDSSSLNSQTSSLVSSSSSKSDKPNVSSSENIVSSSSSSSSSSSTSSTDEKVSLLTELVVDKYFSFNGQTDVVFNNAFKLIGTAKITASSKTVTDIPSEEYKASYRLQMDKQSLEITTISDNATLYVNGICGNSSDTSRQIAITDSTGAEIYKSTPENGFNGKTNVTLTINLPKAGVYTLKPTSKTVNFYYFGLTQEVNKGKEVDFEVDTTLVKKDYFVGDEFVKDNLKVYSIDENGVKTELNDSDYVVDTSAFNKDAEGNYEIVVKYKEFENKKFIVNVHSLENIEVYSEFLVNSKEAIRVSSVYDLNSEFDTSGLVVKAISGSYSEIVTPTITGFDSSSEGKKTITISFTKGNVTQAKNLVVNVISASKLVKDNTNKYQVYVDSSKKDGETFESKLYFNSIQSAHDFIKYARKDNTEAVINLANGEYQEKLYIEVPNITLKGENKDTVKIFEKYIAEDVDAKGNTLSTYGSSSVTVIPGADNFKASNITFDNRAFTTMDEYDNSTKGSKQACAIVVSAKAYFNSCAFNGFQDTLYAREGEQVYENCFITGMTDFIFGENKAKVYIKGGEVKVKYRAKEANKNNGYIVASKADLENTVGFFFNNVNITSEEQVVEGTVALARPWDKNSLVTYANCTMSKAISKAPYGTGEKNHRFEAMSGNSPVNARFNEYNNSGEGSITTPVNGGKFLTEEEYTVMYNAAEAILNSFNS